MNKLLVTGVIILAILSGNMPVSAQKIKGANANIINAKNPVRYAATNAFSDGRGVWIEWQTEVESKNLGFYVYRVSGGSRELISPFIPGAAMQALQDKITSGSYSFFDSSGDINSAYVIESDNVNGQRHNSDLFQTKFVSDLATVAGVTSEQLFEQARNASPAISMSQSLLPADLAAEVEGNRDAPDPIRQRWVAAQPGVKIGVKQEGFYRVTRATLEASGFDVNAPTERWQLYVNGVEQAIIVGAGGAYVDFYGKGVDTLEADTQPYFLLVGTTDGKRIGSVFRRRVGSGVVSENYTQTFYKEERQFYSPQIINGDAENVFGSVVRFNPEVAISFDITSVDFSSPTASIDLTVQGASLVPHQVRVMINNVPLGMMNGTNYDSMVNHFEFPTSVLREGTNNLQLKSMNPPSPLADNSAFDSMKVNFARRYKADQNRLAFHVPNYKSVYAEGFATPNVRVFDTTNTDHPLLIAGLSVEQSGATHRVYLPPNRARVLYAVEDSGMLQAASVVRNAPSTLSSPANNGELVIISHQDFMTQAEEWAVYRRSQGLTVKVIDVVDVYDEFNYGVISPDSIRTFLQYAKSPADPNGGWQTKPNYVFLIGDATYDPRNYFPTTVGNYIPSRMFDSIYGETNSDETMGDFNNDGLAEIAVGRIPVRTAAQATMLLGKLMTYEQNVSTSLNRGAIFAYDLPDGYDFQALSLRLRDQLPTNIPRIMVGRELPNANTELVSQMNQGRLLVNYSGHGSSSAWATTGFFGNAHAGVLTNSGTNLSVYTMLTCLNGYFLNPTDSLSEVLLKNPNGGAVTTWASSGLTTADIQEVMATRFYNRVAAGTIPRVGDLIKDAKTTINFGRDVRLSWVLLGDPTTRVR